MRRIDISIILEVILLQVVLSPTGRLEVLHNGVWGTVCDDQWDGNSVANASVACRQMGASSGDVTSRANYTDGTGQIWMDDVVCGSTAGRCLQQCTRAAWGDQNCSHSEDIGLTCNDSNATDCHTTTLRLVNSSGTVVYGAGLVNGKCANVTDDPCINNNSSINVSNQSHNQENAKTACFDGSTQIASVLNGEEHEDLVNKAKNLGCEETWIGLEGEQSSWNWVDQETSNQRNWATGQPLAKPCTLVNPLRKWETELCGNSKDCYACKPCPNSGCTITGSASSSSSSVATVPTEVEGRLEVQHNNRWGTVCDDSWVTQNSTVACRQMGYNSGSRLDSGGSSSGSSSGGSDPDYYQGRSSQTIWLDDLSCSSSGISCIQSCSYNRWGEHNCGHSEDVGLRCSGLRSSTSCTTKTLRIVNKLGAIIAGEGTARCGGSEDRCMGETRSNSGGQRLEVRHNGRWGTICDDLWTGTQGTINARVSCRAMGQTTGTKAQTGSYSVGSSSKQIWLDNVDCNGTETRLDQCAHRGWGVENCTHSEDIGVICTGTQNTTQISDCNLRLCGDNGCSTPPTCTEANQPSAAGGTVAGIIPGVIVFAVIAYCCCKKKKPKAEPPRSFQETQVQELQPAQKQPEVPMQPQVVQVLQPQVMQPQIVQPVIVNQPVMMEQVNPMMMQQNMPMMDPMMGMQQPNMMGMQQPNMMMDPSMMGMQQNMMGMQQPNMLMDPTMMGQGMMQQPNMMQPNMMDPMMQQQNMMQQNMMDPNMMQMNQPGMGMMDPTMMNQMMANQNMQMMNQGFK